MGTPGIRASMAGIGLALLFRGPGGHIHGCYVPAARMSVSTADPYVLMHELKHYFEGLALVVGHPALSLDTAAASLPAAGPPSIAD